MRGIVVNCEYEGTNSGIKIISTSIDPVKLREYLLYWDKIDFPCNNAVYIGLSPEEEYLENTGILKRTKFDFKGGLIDSKVFIDSQLDAFYKNNKISGEVWSIAQPTNKVILPKDKSVKTRCIEVELYNCIPVPNSNVTLEDILNFKEHRKDELQEFRTLMDETYLSILNSPDQDFSMNTSIERLKSKINDINRIMDESIIEKVLRNTKIEIDFGNLTKNVMSSIAGLTVGQAINMPLVGATAGFLSSTINIKAEFSLRPTQIPKDLKDYAYLIYQKKELV